MSDTKLKAATTLGMIAGIIGLEEMEKMLDTLPQAEECPDCGGYLRRCEATGITRCIDCFHLVEEEE